MKARGIIYKVKPAFVNGSFKTYEHNRQVEIPVLSTTYVNPIQVDWGDGTVETLDSASGTYPSHTYQTEDDNAEFTIRITSASGKLPNLCFGEQGASISDSPHIKARATIVSVDYWNAKQYYNGTPISGEYSSNGRFNFNYCFNLTRTCVGVTRNDVNKTSNESLYRYCQLLTNGIYKEMFEHNATVTNMTEIFQACHILVSSIPYGLFKNCIAATSFTSAFFRCWSLTGEIPSDIFVVNTNVLYFKNTFSDCRELAGTAPELWVTHSTADGTGCFTGCTGLSNYAEIPSGWK